MATVHDVAAYILQRTGPITAMKLQKLCYYAQAWHMTWDEEELFPEDFQAWANGPVCLDLYRQHRGRFNVDDWQWGDPAALSPQQRESVDAVVDHYDRFTAQQLSDLTHQESPWRDARVGLAPGERANVVIPKAAMHEFYSGLDRGA